MKRMNKKSIVCFMLLLVMLSNTFVFADNTDVNYKTLIVVSDSAQFKTIEAGEKVEITIPVTNKGRGAANTITVSMSGETPFDANAYDLTKEIGYLGVGQTEEVTFVLDVSQKSISKIYEIELIFNSINTYGDRFTSQDTIHLPVENKNIPPTLAISSVHNRDGNDLYEQNKADVLLINFKNTGTLPAKDVMITLTGLSDETILLNGDADTKKIQKIEPGQISYTFFNVMAGKKSSGGRTGLTAHVEYIDAYGEKFIKDLPVYVSVEGNDSSSAKVSIQNIVVPAKVISGDSFEIQFDVVNNGRIPIEEVILSPEYSRDFVLKSATREVVKNLGPGEVKTKKFIMMNKKDSSVENGEIFINARYFAKGDNASNAVEIKEYVSLNVDSKGATSRPKLIVESYEFGGENVLAGENFDLILNIQNTSRTMATQNIKVTVESSEGVFIPVESSNSFFVDYIGPGEISKQSIKLKTKIDSQVQIYPLKVIMAYEDGDGKAYDDRENPYQESESLSIAVSQPVRLEPGEIMVPQQVNTNEKFYVEQEFYNMGKSTMYNMLVKLKGFETNEGTYFVGNFNAGSNNYFSAQCYVTEPGDYEGVITYQFEDALGNVSTVEKKINLTAVEGAPMDEFDFKDMNMGDGDMDGMVPTEEESGGMSKVVIVIVMIVIIGGVVFFVKKKKNKKNSQWEDDDE